VLQPLDVCYCVLCVCVCVCVCVCMCMLMLVHVFFYFSPRLCIPTKLPGGQLGAASFWCVFDIHLFVVSTSVYKRLNHSRSSVLLQPLHVCVCDVCINDCVRVSNASYELKIEISLEVQCVCVCLCTCSFLHSSFYFIGLVASVHLISKGASWP
jgi:hypothetical protein